MIKVDLVAEPKFLQSQIVDLAIEKMTSFYSSKDRRQKRYNWPFNREIDQELKKYLHEAFHGKCGYCERAINEESGTVDRYRPNNGVRDDNKYFQDLYWWLTFEWRNLVYCCKECNQYKANYFPIKGKRATKPDANLTDEVPLLLHPVFSTLDRHFSYDISGEIRSSTIEGTQTIELLRLNRNFLVEKRKISRQMIIESVEYVLGNIESTAPYNRKQLAQIYELEDPTVEFLSYKRLVLLDELDSNRYLGQLLELEDYEEEEESSDYFYSEDEEREDEEEKEDFGGVIMTSDYFPIEYVKIKNFKSISDLIIDFRLDELDKKSWLFLLGENGVGKSSILQAIAIGLKADKDLLKPLIPALIMKGKQKAEIEIKERDSNNVITTVLVRKDSSIEQSGEFKSYLIGYGSLRLSVEEAEDGGKVDTAKISYNNLMRPVKPLNDITKWLKSIHKKDIAFFDRIAYSIKQLLPHDFTDNELTIEKGVIMFKNSEKIFSELSDGFKSTITLAVDIMMRLSNAQSDMDKMSGVVLIDELGNQLHPRWQMRIVKQLRTVFPNINFIVSTHHPLCLRGAEKEEILLLKNIKNEIESTTTLPDPALLRVDQILASEFFGLNSLVDPELEAKFNRYYELLAKNQTITSEEEHELAILRDTLKNKHHLGTSLREELMYTVIDKLLAQKVAFNKNVPSRQELKDEVVERVKEVWRNLNLDENDLRQ